jgi:hypothetical protein
MTHNSAILTTLFCNTYYGLGICLLFYRWICLFKKLKTDFSIDIKILVKINAVYFVSLFLVWYYKAGIWIYFVKQTDLLYQLVF